MLLIYTVEKRSLLTRDKSTKNSPVILEFIEYRQKRKRVGGREREREGARNIRASMTNEVSTVSNINNDVKTTSLDDRTRRGHCRVYIHASELPPSALKVMF